MEGSLRGPYSVFLYIELRDREGQGRRILYSIQRTRRGVGYTAAFASNGLLLLNQTKFWAGFAGNPSLCQPTTFFGKQWARIVFSIWLAVLILNLMPCVLRFWP